MVSTTRARPDVAALDVADAKQILRTHFRELRRARPMRERTKLAEDLAKTALGVVRGARCVAAYVSRPTEPGTLPLLASLQDQGVRVLLPVLGPGLSRGWAEYRGDADLAERAPGRPLEPSGAPSGAEMLAEADVVITPALAVDPAGYRLGQGGGWYDRALCHVRPGTLVIAAVYDEEVVEGPLPRDEHDVAVHGALTPSRRWTFADA